MTALAVLRLVAVSFFFALSLLAVLKAPLGFLWKPAVAATEFGHILAGITFLLALPGWSNARGQLETVLALVATVLFLTPVLRAIPVGSALPAKFEAAFGPVEAQGLPTPFSLTRLGGIGAAKVGPVELTVDGRPVHVYSADAKPKPVVIMIHGGSWNSGDPTQLPAINHRLATQGYAVVAVTYRLAPEHTHPAALEDVIGMLDWVRANADTHGFDARRIVFAGRSAGGHLALLAAYRAGDPAVKGAIAYYPPIDLVWSWHHPSNPLVLNSPKTLGEFLGGPYDAVPDVYADASPYHNVDGAVPSLFIHGGRDELVFCEQSERLDAHLDATGVPHLFVKLPWATHGLDANLAGPGGQISTWAIERFLAAVTK